MKKIIILIFIGDKKILFKAKFKHFNIFFFISKNNFIINL
jgi:hypothetical protein